MPHTHSEKLTSVPPENPAQSTSGIVLHSPVLYDFTVWLALFGKEHIFRDRVLNLARLAPGDCVLDIGCGTGTLAITAKRRVGPTGTVQGVDASREMLARAQKKAKKAGVQVSFREGLVEGLPFQDAQFDVVLSTVMLHHLPQKARLQCVNEIRRVLKPSGRVLVVDFEGFNQQKRSFLSHFHRPHGHVSSRDVTALIGQAGLRAIETGSIGIRDLQFVLAVAPDC